MPTEEERNVAVVRSFIDAAVDGGDLAVIDTTWADDMTWHGGSMGTIDGRDDYTAFVAANAVGAWDRMHLEIHEIVARDDKVVVRLTNRDTNTGRFLGNPATDCGDGGGMPQRGHMQKITSERLGAGPMTRGGLATMSTERNRDG